MSLDMQLSLLQLVLTVVSLSVQVDSLWELLCPLIRTALSNITIETYADWGTCIATACVSFCRFVSCISFHVFTSCRSPVFPHDSRVVQESRDPRKLHWLFEMLMESPVNGEGGSFVDAWWVERLLPGADINQGDSVRLTLLLLLLQSSVCATGRPSSARVARLRAPPQTAAIPRAQTHTGLQKCSGTNWKVKPWKP